MDTKIMALLLVLFALFSGSCHLFENVDETENVAVYFNESNVSVYEGGLGSLSLRIEPPDGLPYYTVDYKILNEEVAAIFRADRRGVVFSGRKEGSTVITANIGNAEAKAVINVFGNYPHTYALGVRHITPIMPTAWKAASSDRL